MPKVPDAIPISIGTPETFVRALQRRKTKNSSYRVKNMIGIYLFVN